MNGLTFHCDQCGLCCVNLNKSEVYSDLHDGDGICKYYDQQKKQCTIYDKRPLKCNIEKAYETTFQSVMPYEDYLEVNYMACASLKIKQMSKEND